MDIGLDSSFDIALDDRNDLPIVEGRAAFEQRLAVRVTDYFNRIIGEVAGQNALKLVILEAQRVAQDTDGLDSVASIRADFAEDQPNTIEVSVYYDTNDEFSLTLSE